MAGSVGQGSSLVDAAALFALGVGVVGRERPGRQKLPAGGQLHPLGGGLADVDVVAEEFLAEAAAVVDAAGLVGLAGPVAVGPVGAAGVLVREAVREPRVIGSEAGQAVGVRPQLGS